jgi:hypothetical protein
MKADEVRHARQLQDLETITQGNVDKDIPREQREFQFLSPILPPPHRSVERYKAFNTPSIHLNGHVLFVSWIGISRIPPRLQELRGK